MTNEEKEALQEVRKLESQGIFAHDPLPYEKTNYKSMAVVVEAALPEGAVIKPFNWNIEWINSRGASMIFSDWHVGKSSKDQDVISFTVHMRIPNNVVLDLNTSLEFATSYRDLLWFHGHEAIDDKYEPQEITKVREDAMYNDLGWYLPCRFADRLVEALGKVNETFLSGILEDAIIYGIIVK